MKLVASVMAAPLETDRYLTPCIESLLEFCDEVRVRYEVTSPAQLPPWVLTQPKVATIMTEVAFYEHEGRARQELLKWTLLAKPTHVLAIDADEFVTDGQLLRAELEEPSERTMWSLCMEEIWRCEWDDLRVRCDGGWTPRPIVVAYKVPDPIPPTFRIPDVQLACGRIPVDVRSRAAARRVRVVDASVYHFGWACEADRAERHQRYVEHDGGRFHRSNHLDSIMWSDARVRTEMRDWPESLETWRERIIRRSMRGSL